MPNYRKIRHGFNNTNMSGKDPYGNNQTQGIGNCNPPCGVGMTCVFGRCLPIPGTNPLRYNGGGQDQTMDHTWQDCLAGCGDWGQGTHSDNPDWRRDCMSSCTQDLNQGMFW